jgi:hypothetical protein
MSQSPQANSNTIKNAKHFGRRRDKCQQIHIIKFVHEFAVIATTQFTRKINLSRNCNRSLNTLGCLSIWPKHGYFRIGANFEMRTALYEIRLFNDKLVMNGRVFISKQIILGESKIVERQKERESLRDSALLEMRDGVVNKID